MKSTSSFITGNIVKVSIVRICAVKLRQIACSALKIIVRERERKKNINLQIPQGGYAAAE